MGESHRRRQDRGKAQDAPNAGRVTLHSPAPAIFEQKTGEDGEIDGQDSGDQTRDQRLASDAAESIGR